MSGLANGFCDQHEQAAAYVLGALESSEAVDYRAHLVSCAECRAETNRLRPAVDWLAATAPPEPAPPALRNRVMAVVRSEAELLNAAGASADRARVALPRWRSRRRTILAASGALATGLAVGAFVIASGSGPAPHLTRAIVATTAPGARALVREVGGHAELLVRAMPAPPVGKIYQVWLARANAAPTPTDALFSVTSDGDGSVDIPGALHGTQRLMVTAEPLGGSRQPTSKPVITATLRLA